MDKAIRTDRIQCTLPGMSKRGMSKIMSQSDSFHQVFIHPECLCNRPRILGYLKGMRHTGTVVIPLRCQKYLRLILQSPEGLRMQDPVTVTLIDRTDITLLLLPKPPFRIAAVCRIGT